MTWPHLRIIELAGRGSLPGEILSLLVQDEDFVAEVGWMGHGLQMWLQTMWFIARTKRFATIILDEPDVYMHPDLQRKLIMLVQKRYKQVIVATHSIEIMSEVGANEVLVIDRKRRKSKFTTSLPAVQRVIDHIGGVQNLQLARLWTSRKCLLLEGKDIRILKNLQNKLFPNSQEPLDMVPNMPIGGWGGWSYAVGSSMLLKNSGGQDIIPYCVLDSDYHTPAEISTRISEAKERSVQLHVFKRKEIENYCLTPSTIQRTIAAGVRRGLTPPSESDILSKLDEISDSLKDEVHDAIASDYLSQFRSKGLKAANTYARALINENWSDFFKRISIVPGKRVIAMLSAWSHKTYGVSLTAEKIASNFLESEIDVELITVIDCIENNEKWLS